MQRKGRQTGLTMVELLVVVAIAAILASIASPSFTALINNTRLSSTMSQLTNDLNRARLEAIKRNSWVLVCVRNAGNDCGTGTNWQNGWVVCHIGNSAATTCDASTATNPNPIAVHQAINTHHTLVGSVAAIRFNPNGTQGNGAVATLTLCCKSDSVPNTSVASISMTGHISRQ